MTTHRTMKRVRYNIVCHIEREIETDRERERDRGRERERRTPERRRGPPPKNRLYLLVVVDR